MSKEKNNKKVGESKDATESELNVASKPEHVKANVLDPDLQQEDAEHQEETFDYKKIVEEYKEKIVRAF